MKYIQAWGTHPEEPELLVEKSLDSYWVINGEWGFHDNEDGTITMHTPLGDKVRECRFLGWMEWKNNYTETFQHFRETKTYHTTEEVRLKIQEECEEAFAQIQKLLDSELIEPSDLMNLVEDVKDNAYYDNEVPF